MIINLYLITSEIFFFKLLIRFTQQNHRFNLSLFAAMDSESAKNYHSIINSLVSISKRYK